MRRHRLIYASSYDRGLRQLLTMWPHVRRAFPEAALAIAYGWDIFDKIWAGDREAARWKARMTDLMSQPGITHYGRVGWRALAALRRHAGLWAYPTHFDEINCITALEMQRDGVVPVVMDRAALRETVGSGVRVPGDILADGVPQRFLGELLALMGDEDRWCRESQRARAFAAHFGWPTIADQWLNVFDGGLRPLALGPDTERSAPGSAAFAHGGAAVARPA